MKKTRANQRARYDGHARKLVRVMKLCMLFFLIGTSIGWGNPSCTQRIPLNLNLQDVTLERVFDAIRSQSEFEFFYNDDQVNTAIRTSIKVKNANLEDVLDKILPESYEYKVSDRYVLISRRKDERKFERMFPDQTHRLSGRVVDSKGEPIIGANIVEVGTTNGTVTDVNGHFTGLIYRLYRTRPSDRREIECRDHLAGRYTGIGRGRGDRVRHHEEERLDRIGNQNFDEG